MVKDSQCSDCRRKLLCTLNPDYFDERKRWFPKVGEGCPQCKKGILQSSYSRNYTLFLCTYCLSKLSLKFYYKCPDIESEKGK